MTESTRALSDAGVSIWLDDLSRERLASGSLRRLVAERDVVGVTTNPTIFAAALRDGGAYAEQMRELAAEGAEVDEAIFRVTTDDVRAACELLLEVYERSGGFDGRVSIEVSPLLARDTEGTIAEAQRLWDAVGMPNAMIKIPATAEGIPAIAETISRGISVNATLIFSLSRYREVVNAYLLGLERAREQGRELSAIHSVASFFVSRLDSEVDRRLDGIGSERARELRSQAALANARLAYQVYEQAFATERARLLLAEGANPQRPLWASTGVKDPALDPAAYVTGLVAPDTVNTMPEQTLAALEQTPAVEGGTVQDGYHEANRLLDALAGLGIDYREVVELLEREGVDKFIASWEELRDTVRAQLQAASPGASEPGQPASEGDAAS